MRLLIIGRLSGELVAASNIAMQRGAAVTQADAVAQGLNVLRAKGADLIMIDVAQPIATLVAALDAERIRTPVVACGTGTDARAAVADNLLEAELFGHEKGSFTGAVARRIGKFEEANGGTLLLDEISEMDVRLQAKLLRAIQERVIDRVGGAHPVRVDIRILATSNRNLADEVRKGSFREDLLYRLNVVHLRIPPLRERPADVLELASYFGRKYADLNGVPQRSLTVEPKRLMTRSSWRGNVRELENR